MAKKPSRALKLGDDLPPHFLAALIKKRLADREHFKSVDVDDYPDSPDAPGIVLTDNPAECVFPCRHPFRSDVNYFRRGGKKNKGGKGKGKGKGKGNQGGNSGPNGKKWPDPKVVRAEVLKLFANVPLAGNTGDLVVGFTNLEFWLQKKAAWFEDAANEMVTRVHHMGVEEVGAQGIAHTGKVAGYTTTCSPENTRHQAVGAMAHPRLKLLKGPIFLNSVATVQGIPDLRPGHMCIYKDTTTGQVIAITVLHLKSMIGGPKVTSVVRYKQFDCLVIEKNQVLPAELAKLGITDMSQVGEIVGGDLNYPINDKSFQEADPLIADGFQLLEPNDTQGTQASKSTRLDGMFYKNITSGLQHYSVYAYFQVPTLGRSFTDHATITAKVPSPTSTGKSSGSAAAGTTAPTATPAPANTPAPAKTPAPKSTDSKTTGGKSDGKTSGTKKVTFPSVVVGGTKPEAKEKPAEKKIGGADLKPVKLKKFKKHDKRTSRKR